MRILHTSDWHLGQNFKNRSREEEHIQFLNWLLETLKKEKIDVLIVAGDIFDSYNPPNYALKMYHSFLAKASKICKYIFIIAGNHDSIANLEVSKDILKEFNVFVVAKEGEVFEIEDVSFCVVPFLREDVLKIKAKSLSEEEVEIAEAIKNYYLNLKNQAKGKKVIATGHLSVSGANFSDSEREIYIGKVKTISAKIFKDFDFVLLGHIHKPQKLGNIIYSGSPIPLSFSETENKKVFVIDDEVKEIDIPIFKKLISLKGKFGEIKNQLLQLQDINNPPFVEIELDEFVDSMKLDELKIEGVDIVAIKQKRMSEELFEEDVEIDKLTPLKVFEKRLDLEESLSEKDKKKLTDLYINILKEVEYEN